MEISTMVQVRRPNECTNLEKKKQIIPTSILGFEEGPRRQETKMVREEKMHETKTANKEEDRNLGIIFFKNVASLKVSLDELSL